MRELALEWRELKGKHRVHSFTENLLSQYTKHQTDLTPIFRLPVIIILSPIIEQPILYKTWLNPVSGTMKPWARLWTPLCKRKMGRGSPFNHAREENPAPTYITGSVWEGRHWSILCFADVGREFIGEGKGQTHCLSTWHEGSYKYCDTCLQELRTTSALTHTTHCPFGLFTEAIQVAHDQLSWLNGLLFPLKIY